MIASVYRPRRQKNGKSLVSRLYRARIRLSGEIVISDVPLKTSDRAVAQKRLDEIVRERERVRAGLIAPKLERESAQRPILEHLADFVADLEVLGRSRIYRKQVARRISRVVRDRKWRLPCDITVDGFVAWRSVQKDLGPKTLNEYLNALGSLLNWMERHGRISANPLARASRVDTRGRQQRRRAFTNEEFGRLLAVAGKWRTLYLTAAYTGLRSGELRQLVWADVKLDHERPHIVLRAITAKNRRDALIPLHPELLTELRQIKATGRRTGPADAVFVGCRQTWRIIRKHIDAAGIKRLDETGRKLDFHALRYTFATQLAQSGVSQRTTQELLRHSDPRLTANIYTDVTQLPTFSAVENLPWLSGWRGDGAGTSPMKDSQIHSQKLATDGRKTDEFARLATTELVSDSTGSPHGKRVLAHSGVPGHGRVEGTGREGLERAQGRPEACSQSVVYGTTAELCAQLHSQPTCMADPVLSDLNNVWPKLPEHIRLAIGALVKSCSV